MDTQQQNPPDPVEGTHVSLYSALAGEPLAGSKKTLEVSWGIYKKAWKSYVGVILIMIISFIIPFMALVLTFAGRAVLKNAGNFAAIMGNASGVMVIIGVLLFIPFMLWLSLLSMTGALLPGFADERARLGIVFKFTLRKFGSLLWVSFLYIVIVFAGTILFIVPGIIWAIFYSMAFYVCAFEDQKGMAALRRSKELVKGYVWTLLSRWSFLMYVAILSAIVGLIPLIGWVWQIAALFIVTPLQYVYWFAIYITIRERKNRGLVTDAATGRQKAGTVFLLIGSIIALILFGLVSNRLKPNKTTRMYPIQEETGALGEAVQE